MFATLVIALPSISTGGDLFVRHAGREARISMSGDDAAEARFAAFYADSVHEVLPAESGRRVTLIFNLVRATRDDKPIPPRHNREEQALGGMLASWEQETASPAGPTPRRSSIPWSTPIYAGRNIVRLAEGRRRRGRRGARQRRRKSSMRSPSRAADARTGRLGRISRIRALSPRPLARAGRRRFRNGRNLRTFGNADAVATAGRRALRYWANACFRGRILAAGRVEDTTPDE